MKLPFDKDIPTEDFLGYIALLAHSFEQALKLLNTLGLIEELKEWLDCPEFVDDIIESIKGRGAW